MKLPKRIAFMDVPGSDPSAAMKGDNAQHVDTSTAPGTAVRAPKRPGPRGYIVKGGNIVHPAGGPFSLPRGGRPGKSKK
jgi:hypothetical protein